jgi:SNF2 family DNA or RNA helicase
MVHGAGRKLDWGSLRNYDIVLTTYGTLGAEFKRMERWDLEQKTRYGRDYDQAPMQKLFPLMGPKSIFHRIILDEAQYIKNKNTQSAKACCHLKAKFRLCLTGTPMMNNVGELYSLIHFLQIRPYNSYNSFQAEFKCLSKGDSTKRESQNAMKKLQAVLKAILLRRTKQSKIDGEPIITLPPKTEEIQHVVFNEDEQAFYSALETKTQIQFNKYMKANTVGKNYSNILVLLLRLRQCCCHPHLITDFEEATLAGADISVETMLELARSLAPDVVGRLLAAEAGAFEVSYSYSPSCYIC